MTEEAVRPWKALFSQLQPKTELRMGLLGDGLGNVSVPGKPGWNWIRYRDDLSRLSMVRNVAVARLGDGVPVMVGKRHYTDEYEQVLWVYWDPYVQDADLSTIDQYAGGEPHGDKHAGKANDPVPVDLNNLSPGKVVPTDPASLFVDVQQFMYVTGCDVFEYPGESFDLTSHIPAIYGRRYVMVYLDLETDAVDAVDGDVVGWVDTPTIPDPLPYTIPLAIIDLESGQATITDSDIYQYKVMYLPVCGDVGPHTHSSDAEGGQSLLNVQELMFDCWVDITIDGGEIIPTDVYHRLVVPEGMYISEGSISVELLTIHADTTYGCGQVIILRTVAPSLYTSYNVVLRHGTGNIWLNGGSDITLGEGDHVMLVYDGEGYWHDVGLCCGGGGGGGDLPASVRGYILRGGVADWEAYDANDNGKILVGDGVDINSVSLTGDGTLSGGGALKVTALQNYDVQDHAPLDGEVLVWNNTNSRWEPGRRTECIYLYAYDGWPSTTNGCAALAQTEYGVNDVDLQTLDFDQDMIESAQWTKVLPPDYDGGTVTARIIWTAGADAGGTTRWLVSGRAYANDDAIDQAMGVSQAVTDTLTAVDDVCVTAETAAITLAGGPAAGEMVQFKVEQDGEGGDLEADAMLIAVVITYTRTAA